MLLALEAMKENIKPVHKNGQALPEKLSSKVLKKKELPLKEKAFLLSKRKELSKIDEGKSPIQEGESMV